MSKLQFWSDVFWFKVATYSSRRISDEGKMAIAVAMERNRADEEHRVIH